MALSPAGQPLMKSSSVWDNSATIYMNEVMQDSPTVRVKDMGMKDDGILMVHLYVDTPERNICLNDHLLVKEYASVDDSDSEEMNDSHSVSSTDSLPFTQSSDRSLLISSPEKTNRIKTRKRSMFKKFTNMHAGLQAEWDQAIA